MLKKREIVIKEISSCIKVKFVNKNIAYDKDNHNDNNANDSSAWKRVKDLRHCLFFNLNS